MTSTTPSPSEPYPGFPSAEAELSAAAGSGTKAVVDALGAMAILGELDRLRGRVRAASELLSAVETGRGCWAAQQGYTACEHPGVAEFRSGTPRRRRWFRRER